MRIEDAGYSSVVLWDGMEDMHRSVKRIRAYLPVQVPWYTDSRGYTKRDVDGLYPMEMADVLTIDLNTSSVDVNIVLSRRWLAPHLPRQWIARQYYHSDLNGLEGMNHQLHTPRIHGNTRTVILFGDLIAAVERKRRDLVDFILKLKPRRGTPLDRAMQHPLWEPRLLRLVCDAM